MTTVKLQPPALRPDGACPECLGRGLCDYHKQTTQAAWIKRERALQSAGRATIAGRIARICASFELESDEFYTAEQKAQQYIEKGIAI